MLNFGFSLRERPGTEGIYEIVRPDGSLANSLSDGEYDMLTFLCDAGLIGKENITDVIDHSISMSASECTAFLLERQSELGCSSDPLLDEL